MEHLKTTKKYCLTHVLRVRDLGVADYVVWPRVSHAVEVSISLQSTKERLAWAGKSACKSLTQLSARGLVPCHARLSIGLLVTWLPPEWVTQESANGSTSVYYNLIAEVMDIHFPQVLLVTQTNLGALWEGTIYWHDCQEVEIIRLHPGKRLSVKIGCYTRRKDKRP